MLRVILLFVLLSCYFALDAKTNRSSVKEYVRRRSLIPVLYDNLAIAKVNLTKSRHCHWLKGYSFQRKQCNVRRGLEAVLLDARKLAIQNCRERLKYNRWNCTYDKNIFKKVSREAAFMQSLASAALMFSVTQACSSKKLERCKCDKTKEFLVKIPPFRYEGCGDNTKTGKNIIRNFLMAQNLTKKSMVLNHNVIFGMMAVLNNTKIYCRCPSFDGGPARVIYGTQKIHNITIIISNTGTFELISISQKPDNWTTRVNCAWRLCEKRIQSFDSIVEKLKLGYHTAIKLKTRHLSVNASAYVKKSLPHDRLVYLAPNKDFCPLTTGRRCRDADNCATICCGRGFSTRTITVRKECNHKFTECCFNVTHEICHVEERIYECK